jgi:hypothetical protein
MNNGDTGLFRSSLLSIKSGRALLPPLIALINPEPLHNAIRTGQLFRTSLQIPQRHQDSPTKQETLFTDIT